MACRVIHSWTFTTLIGAFLDLSIAYLLLSVSCFAFFASKLLDVFGLSLPCCSCDGLFGDPTNKNGNNYCLQKQLVECPSSQTGRVQLEVKTRFPFDVMWNGDPHCHKKCVSSDNEFEEEEWLLGNKGKKRIIRSRRRRGASVDFDKLFCVSSRDEVYQFGARKTATPPPSRGNQGSEVPSSSDGMEASRPKRISRLELNEHGGKTKYIENDASSSVENFGGSEHEKPMYDSNDKTTVWELEQALDEEHNARTALYYELEKERSAAATAADEAMAMILRLQEEKASIEMEARQNQRMIQEKYNYDAEEMNILKEIILRREREKHFLEKEVDYYRQLLFGNDQVDDVMHDVAATGAQSISRIPSEELLLMLEQKSDSIGEKSKLQMVNGTSGKALPVPYLEEGDTSKQMDSRIHSHNLNNIFGIDNKFQEKGMVYVDERLVSQGKEVQVLNAEERELVEKSNARNRHKLDLGSKDQQPSSLSNSGPHVDVHVIDEKFDFYNDKKAEKSKQLLGNANIDITETLKSMTELGAEHIVHEVGSDTGNEFSTVGGFQASPYDMRRNSMSSADTRRNSEHIVHEVGSDTGNEFSTVGGFQASPYDMRRNSMSSADTRRNSVSLADMRINSMSSVDYGKSKMHDKVYQCSPDMTPSYTRRNSMSAIDYERWKIDSKLERGSSDTEKKDMRRNSMTAVDYERWKSGNKSFRGSTDASPRGSTDASPSPSPSVMRRNSISAVDYERCKLDNEVEWLRERLRIVQEGREKLNFSVGHRKSEKVQRKLLEDITSQLQEIRQMTEPRKVKSQAALPPPSSKVMSKKRRCRTLPVGVDRTDRST